MTNPLILPIRRDLWDARLHELVAQEAQGWGSTRGEYIPENWRDVRGPDRTCLVTPEMKAAMSATRRENNRLWMCARADGLAIRRKRSVLGWARRKERMA